MELATELIGFLVVLFVLWRHVLPVLTALVRARQDDIQRQVEAAEQATRALQHAEHVLETAERRARVDAARVRADATADAHRLHAQLLANADTELARTRLHAHAQMQAHWEWLVRRLTAQFGEAVLEAAERLVRRELLDDATRTATIDTALSEIEQHRRDTCTHPATPARPSR